jgi:hypothetical protein
MFSHTERNSTPLSYLLGSQKASTLLLSRLLSLVSFVKGDGVAVVTAKIVEVLDLVDTDDPVLTGKGFF